MLIEENEMDLFDLIDVAPAFGHGVSTLGRMHAGIAVGFRQRFPEMYRAYRKKCFKRELAGGDIFIWPAQHGMPTVFNLITQDTLEYARPKYLEESFERMFYHADRMGIKVVVVPLIGCGYGKLTRQHLIEAADSFIKSASLHLLVVDPEPEDGFVSRGATVLFGSE